MLTQDRCLEERWRLGNEADNLCRWYGRELAAVELAIRTPQCKCHLVVPGQDADDLHVDGSDSAIAFLLEQRRAELLLLQGRWRTPLASEERYNFNTREAVRIAQRLSGVPVTQSLYWVNVTSQDTADSEIETRPEPEEALFDADTVLAQDCIDDLLNDDNDDNEDRVNDYNTSDGSQRVSSGREHDECADGWLSPLYNSGEHSR